MARVRVLSTPKRLTGPITFWVHRPVDNEVWAKATRFDPPLPEAGPDGYPHYVVEHLGHEVWFASLDEVLHAEEVLSREPLPSGSELAREAGCPERDYMHWIETFPARLKADDERHALVKMLRELREKIESEA